MKDLFNWNMDNFKFNFSRRVSLGAKVLITKVLIKCYCAMSDFLVTFLHFMLKRSEEIVLNF